MDPLGGGLLPALGTGILKANKDHGGAYERYIALARLRNDNTVPASHGASRASLAAEQGCATFFPRFPWGPGDFLDFLGPKRRSGLTQRTISI